MKEIEYKIIDSVFGEFNQELIGDKVKLQNKVNKYQRMIDMINYLQPVEEIKEEVKEEFFSHELYTVKVTNNEEFLCVLDHLHKGNSEYHKNSFKKYSENGVYYIGINSQDWFYNHKNNHTQNPEITFEQFKKYVLNK